MTAVKTTKSMYLFADGFRIDKIISDIISENKRKFFKELNRISLKKVVNYCYSNTYDKCCGTEECYFCTIVFYVNQEFRERRENNKRCMILRKGKNNCTCYECINNNKLHYLL